MCTTCFRATDRELLVPEADRRARLWTSRVWPGAVLVGGEIIGTWRRAEATVTVDAWQRLSNAEREAVESEAAGLPLPGLKSAIQRALGRRLRSLGRVGRPTKQTGGGLVR